MSAGSFLNGYMFEYSSLGWPGTTVVGTNSILSIKPSSIAAMRTLRANGEAGEKVSFIKDPLKEAPWLTEAKQSMAPQRERWIASSLALLAMTRWKVAVQLGRNNLLP